MPLRDSDKDMKNTAQDKKSAEDSKENIELKEGKDLSMDGSDIKIEDAANIVKRQDDFTIQDSGSKPPQKIGEKLITKGLVSPDQLQIALKIQKQNSTNQRKMLGGILVELGFITESALGEVLAEATGVQRFDPKEAVLDPTLIRQLPKQLAARHKVLPVLLNGETVYLAMADIYNVLAIDQAQRHFPKNFKIVPVYCPESEIVELIDRYHDFEMSIDGILKEIETGISNKAQISGENESYVNPTVRLVDSLLVDAIKQGASDLHFEPEDAFLRLRYRIDGKLRQIKSFHKDYWSAIAVRIKIISGMNIAEVRNPQDGRITYNVLGREVDFRVASQPTVHGENIVLRILDKKKSLVSMDELGFSEHNVTLFKKMLKRPQGIIVVTGPTGSGKTTTLYSVLSYINSIEVNIMTLEDPVEYEIPMIRQSQVRGGTGGMSFGSGMRAIMRQDPDIILVGEVRDKETADMALRAAMTGHQVFTTLHTNDAVGTIARMIDIGVQSELLSGSLVGTIAQRLVRKLCVECKMRRPAKQDECKILGVDRENPPMVYEHAGCEKCGYTGYKGRQVVAEILHVDKYIDELIATQASRNKILDYALSKGFVSMAQDGIKKVLDGITDLEEIIRCVDLTDRM